MSQNPRLELQQHYTCYSNPLNHLGPCIWARACARLYSQHSPSNGHKSHFLGMLHMLMVWERFCQYIGGLLRIVTTSKCNCSRTEESSDPMPTHLNVLGMLMELWIPDHCQRRFVVSSDFGRRVLV